MKGIEIARAYYEEYGKAVTDEFHEALPYMAAGFFGAGSECMGYDDEISRDHDFFPGFCIFLPGEDTVDRRTGFLIERAYAKLPKEFMGLKRDMLAPVGGARRGVFRTAEYFAERIGSADGCLSDTQWLSLPEQALLEATNGEMYFDNYGEVSRIRESLSYYPEDIRRKKLAGHLLLAAQAGQYNYKRCLLHGEEAAAQLACAEFVRSAMAAVFLINKKYMPYYKWAFRAMRGLEKMSLNAPLFEYLLSTGNDEDIREEKYAVIEGIASDIVSCLTDEGITRAVCGDLEKHAYSVNDSIENSAVRNMNILAAV